MDMGEPDCITEVQLSQMAYRMRLDPAHMLWSQPLAPRNINFLYDTLMNYFNFERGGRAAGPR